MAQRVVVVGAGVVGLSCAVRLAEAGYDTHVVARDLPAETTSAVAGGLWLPYLAGPAESVLRWGRTTFAELAAICRAHPDAGVRLADGLLLHRDADPPSPPWLAAVSGLAAVHRVSAPRAGFASGWAVRVPLVDPGRYLPWLVARLAAAGGTVTRMALPALPGQGIVVDATGVSARALAHDAEVVPVRGQVVVVANPGLSTWWVDEDSDGRAGAPTYALPRGDHVVVGGTSDVGSWDTEPDADVARAILRRAEAVAPALAGARVLAHRVGLRPSRPAVRVAAEPHAGGAVVHCYGHGGSGYALSWGCADDVLSLVVGLP
jgi:D-amino-acid oxidase